MINVGLFVDVASLYFSVQRKFGEGRKVDYSKLLTNLITDDKVIFTQQAYVITHKESNPEKFLSALRHAGYTTTTLTPRIITTQKAKVFKNDNFDCQISVDVMKYTPAIQQVILCIHSDSFLPLIKHVRESGKRVTIFSCGISNILRNNADESIELTEDYLL